MYHSRGKGNFWRLCSIASPFIIGFAWGILPAVVISVVAVALIYSLSPQNPIGLEIGPYLVICATIVLGVVAFNDLFHEPAYTAVAAIVALLGILTDM